MRFFCCLALVACAPLVFWSLPARAEEYVFLYPNDPSRVFRGTDELILDLPQDLSDEELSDLYLELDGIDVTQSVVLDGTRVTFYPASPYAAGHHMFRIVKLGKNAKLTEIKRWQFSVADGDGQVPDKTVTVEGALNGVYSLRAWDNIDDQSDEPNVQNIQSTADVSVAGQAGRWAGVFTANGFANSDRTRNPAGDGVEVGEYLVNVKNEQDDFSTHVRLGNHDIGASNLLMDHFHRRGVSGFIDTVKNKLRIGEFSMNPASSSGNTNITGVEKDGQRISGGYASVQPFAALGDGFELESTYYTGKGSEDGNGAASTSGSSFSEGTGYQVGLKSVIFPDFLTLRTQFARTDFDEDGRLQTLSKKNANAYNVSLFITPLEANSDRTLDIEASYYRAGADFQTLLNSAAEKDREIWETKAAYLYNGLSLDTDLSWQRDNIGGDPLVPTDGSLQGNSQATYTPTEELFGAPVFSLGGSFSKDDRLDTPAGYTGDGLDRLTTSLNGGVALSFDKTTWSLDHTWTNLNDEAVFGNDYTSHYTDLTLSYRVNDRLTVSPGLQSEFLDDAAEGGSQNWHASLGLDGIILPDRLWNTTNISSQIDKGTGTADGKHYTAETEFTWLMKQAETNVPGFALALSGYYDNDTDTTPDDDEENEEGRVFLRLKFSAPFAR